jgi:hypothetical protein
MTKLTNIMASPHRATMIAPQTIGAVPLLAAIRSQFAPTRRPVRLAGFLTVALLACGAVWLNARKDHGAAAAAVRELAERPTVLAIAGDIAVGHPLVREIEGTWVGRLPNQWMTFGALVRLEQSRSDAGLRERLLPFAERDRRMLVEDISRAKPQVIVIERGEDDWGEWALSDPELAAVLSDYRPVRRAGGVEIRVRANEGRSVAAGESRIE